MILFLYLLMFAVFVAIIFGIIHNGDLKDRVRYGGKVFLQFVGISLVLAWILYFLPL